MSTESNKRIAKNTLFMYLRMLITMVVTLYTSRIVLNTLGENDFGIYNLIGGIVTFFAFLNIAMTNATQRFLNYELGRGNIEQLKKTFSISMTAHISIALLVLLLAETIGLWFVNTQLRIPVERVTAANWVYQFSVLTLLVNIVRVPYNASIIAYERMSFYAYLSVIEVILKLAVVYLLVISKWDKLIYYAALMFAVPLICNIIYRGYCRRKFETCTYTLCWDKKLYLQMMEFSGWSMLGGAANIGAQQGGNILINIFSGLAANAAFGISNQVSSAIYGFVSNFQLAFNPQIVKLYAQKETVALNKLVLRTALFSFYLLLIIAVPLTLNMDMVLRLWLKNVPEYTAAFCTLMIVFYLIDAIQAPLWMTIYASGNIKWHAIVVSGLTILNIPITWALLKSGMPPTVAFITRCGLNFLTAIFRTVYIKYTMGFPSGQYIREVIFRAVIVLCLAFGISYFMKLYLPESISSFLLESVLSCLLTILIIYSIGTSASEKQIIRNAIKSKLHLTTHPHKENGYDNIEE